MFFHTLSIENNEKTLFFYFKIKKNLIICIEVLQIFKKKILYILQIFYLHIHVKKIK